MAAALPLFALMSLGLAGPVAAAEDEASSGPAAVGPAALLDQGELDQGELDLDQGELDQGELGEARDDGTTRIDRAIAVVGERVVTASEVGVALALAERDSSAVEVLAPTGRRPGEWWIEQVLLRELAGDISVYQPQPGEVRERVLRLVEAFDAVELADLEARLGVDRDALSAWVYSRLVVERFVYRNVGLAAEAAGEDAAATRTRYEAWLEELQGSLALRRIAPVREP